MTALRTALAARRLVESSGAWRLLRAELTPVAVAVLGQHLGGDVRQRPAPELFALIDDDLDDLRAQGFVLPAAAPHYCRTWLADGYLIRRPSEAREETYELSEAALVAIRFVQGLEQPRATVTQSRLETIVERLRALAVSTDPDRSTRLAALHEERARIDARIAAVEAGDDEVLPDERATEQALDVLALADELPADFARVRQALELLNRDLRARLIEQPESRGAVLEDIFRGVDLLEQSDEGRTFSAFWTLLLDVEQGTELEDTVAALLDRSFATALLPAQARALRRLLPSLQDAGSQTHQVMTSFSRGLRRFVAGGELAEDRRLHRLLGEAQAEAAAAAGRVKPYHQLRLRLDLTSVEVSRLSGLRLHDPAESRTGRALMDAEAAEVDMTALMALVRASEIDMRELETNLADVLSERGAATLGEVLAARPATQGVASVVGLVVLAQERATRLEGVEQVRWESSGGPRTAHVPLFLFRAEAA